MKINFNFNQFVDDLKNVNPKMPGGWPMPVKLFAFAVIFAIVIVLGFFLDWQDEWGRLNELSEKEGQLKETYMAKKKEAINLDLIKKQLLETQQSFGALLKQLPSKSEMASLLTDINQAGLGRGLQFDLFKPGNETASKELAEQPIVIRVSGSYDDLGKFASDISMMPRIVNLNEISINPSSQSGSSGNTQLTMDAIAKTYRYLDETELSKGKPAGGQGK